MGLVRAHYLLHWNAEARSRGSQTSAWVVVQLRKKKTGAFVHRVVRKDAGGVLSEKAMEQVTHF